VLFDLGDTLLVNEKFDALAGNTRLLELAENGESLRPGDIARLAQELDARLLPLREASEIEFPVSSFSRLLYERLGISFALSPEERAAEFWKAAVTFTPGPGIAEVLAHLDERGIRRAVVSNAMFAGPILEDELAKHDLLEGFEFVMSSADYGVRKPHPLIFETALAKMGIRASDAWYVGDTPSKDVLGAHQAGLGSVWYNRKRRECEDIVPDAEVHGWSEFVELLHSCLADTA